MSLRTDTRDRLPTTRPIGIGSQPADREAQPTKDSQSKSAHSTRTPSISGMAIENVTHARASAIDKYGLEICTTIGWAMARRKYGRRNQLAPSASAHGK